MADENFTETNAGTSDPASKFESSKSHVRQAAEDIRSAAEAKAGELRSAAEAKAQELRGRAEGAYDDVRTKAQSLREDGEQYVRENPTRAIMTALGVGFIFGLIFRR